METHHKIAVKILSGGRAGVIHEFEGSTAVLIGRDADAHIRLHPTEDRMVGRRHARLFFQNNGWYIESLHDQGVLVRGELLPPLCLVQDNEIYRLGPDGPELRIAVLAEAAPETVIDRSSPQFGRAAPSTQPRAEFDPAVLQVSIRQETHRTLRKLRGFVACGALVLVAGVWLVVSRGATRSITASDIQRLYGASVFRAASTVRFRCSHADVQVNNWRRYWIAHGTAFAVAERNGWIYAVTNYHVFGSPSKPILSTELARATLAEETILGRWPLDWPALSERLDDFDARRLAAGTAKPNAQTQIGTERYQYLDEITAQCKFDTEDDAWRQVVVNGRFVSAEIVDSSRRRDVVLFRFKTPAQGVDLLPLRQVVPDDQRALAGMNVYILGFPESGDLPLRRSRDALTSQPAIAQGVLSDIKPDQTHGGYSIQVTAPINVGNSGGPLFDALGNVVGINTWGPSKAEAEGISYALTLQEPIEMLRRHELSWLEQRPR
ncbi:MAG: trypsin-like peptidase domain-containing protein [Planctomycetes bacterium]|nr:trypsin-like peptidase domain-containing protein [Planctomycetota bacterium]